LLHQEFRRIVSFSRVAPERRHGAGFHALRRALGDRLFAEDQAAAQTALGHAAASTTREYYTRARTRALSAAAALERRAAEVMGGRMRDEG
jgi:integrase